MITRKNNITDLIILQVQNLGSLMLMLLAAIRVQAERLKENGTARKIGCFILASLLLILWTLITFRVAQRDAQESFEGWKTRFAEDFISQQEAAVRGMPVDPKIELRKQEATDFAKLMNGLKLYGYGMNDFRTLAQGIACRMANPAYPDTIVEVIEQPKQWPGFSADNEVTQKDFDAAMQILAELNAQEHPAISSDYVYASFERDGITLRDTWDISTKTHFWRYEG